MADTLVVAVSQSGTTTDTNRTVDLARERGAAVIGIVNRRNSDLTDKADGVLYTSDGRDVEMSVASTKAFYAQVAAGALLACAIAELAGTGRGAPPPRAARRAAGAARRHDRGARPPGRRSPRRPIASPRRAATGRWWAAAPNTVAAEEVRIKLSELCYKSIACDVTEDKKHIDLSSEPLILVCAAGLVGSTADDVAKEVAIYRAHKAAPIVIATEGEERFHAALRVISVPAVEPELAFVLSAMVGHLFGYEAALAIDALARPLREAREVHRAGGGRRRVRRPPVRAACALRVEPLVRSASSTSCAPAPTTATSRPAPRCGWSSLLRYAAGDVPLDVYQSEHGVVGTPEVLVDDLTAALSRAIDELTRPVDAIKHQAKTVTVGISRSDESLLGSRLVQAVLAAGAGRDRLSYRTLQALAALDPAVEAVTGFTRYAIEGDPESGDAHIAIVDRGGLAREWPPGWSATRELLGTKRRVAIEREVLVARGRADGRTVLIVPEVKGAHATGHHAAARALRRPPAGRGGQGRAAGLSGPLRAAHRLGDGDRGQLPRRPARRRAGGRPAHAAGDRAGRALAGMSAAGMIGRRHRRRRRRALPPVPGPHARPGRPAVHRRRAGLRRPADRPDRRLAVRFAAKEAVMKALGVGLGAFAFHDVEVVVPTTARPSLVLGGRGEGAGRRPRRAGLAPLAHPHRAVAEAVAIAE